MLSLRILDGPCQGQSRGPSRAPSRARSFKSGRSSRAGSATTCSELAEMTSVLRNAPPDDIGRARECDMSPEITLVRPQYYNVLMPLPMPHPGDFRAHDGEEQPDSDKEQRERRSWGFHDDRAYLTEDESSTPPQEDSPPDSLPGSLLSSPLRVPCGGRPIDTGGGDVPSPLASPPSGGGSPATPLSQCRSADLFGRSVSPWGLPLRLPGPPSSTGSRSSPAISPTLHLDAPACAQPRLPPALGT